MALINKPSPASLTLDVGQRAPRRWMFLMIGLIAIAAYFNSIPNQFAYDDCGIIQGNHFVNDLEWAAIWHTNYWPSPEGPCDLLYRPLTIFSYLANHALDPAPWTFHLVNVLLHALVSILVAVLAWRILRHRWMALLAGALFAVHPLHTEVVANVVGRAELLAALWSLLALLIFLPDQDPLAGPPVERPWWHGILVAACFMLAMLSKETPAALIFGFLFLDVWRWFHWPATRPAFRSWFQRQLLRYHLPVWGAFGAYMAMRIHAVGLMVDTRAIHPMINPLVSATFAERCVTPFLLLAKYVTLMLWPHVLSADYSAPSLMPTANIFQPLPLLGLLMVVAGVATVITYWKHSPRLVALVILLASSYLLVANILRIGTIFGERLFYWPSAFFLMIVAYVLVRLVTRISSAITTASAQRWWRLASAAAILAVLLLAGARTMARNPDWHDNISLALATAQANPTSAKACEWAGTVLVGETTAQWTRDFGVSLLERSKKLYPSMGSAYWELSKYYFRQDRTGDGLIQLAYAALYNGGQSDIRRALKYVDQELRKHPASEYMPAIQQWLAKEPNSAPAHFAMGLALRSQKKNARAESEFAKALVCDPWFPEAVAELGLIKEVRGDYPASVNLLRQYCINIRYNGIARCDLAGALLQLDPHKFPDALREAQMNIERAKTLLPGDPQVLDLMTLLNRKKAAISGMAAKPTPGSVAVAGHA